MAKSSSRLSKPWIIAIGVMVILVVSQVFVFSKYLALQQSISAFKTDLQNSKDDKGDQNAIAKFLGNYKPIVSVADSNAFCWHIFHCGKNGSGSGDSKGGGYNGGGPSSGGTYGGGGNSNRGGGPTGASDCTQVGESIEGCLRCFTKPVCCLQYGNASENKAFCHPANTN